MNEPKYRPALVSCSRGTVGFIEADSEFDPLNEQTGQALQKRIGLVLQHRPVELQICTGGDNGRCRLCKRNNSSIE